MSITGTPASTAGRWPRLATAALLALLLAVLFAVAATLLNAPSASASPVAPAPPGDPFAPTEPGSPDGDGGFSVEINGPDGTPSSAVVTLIGITLLSVAPGAAADDDLLHQDLRGAGDDPQRARRCRRSRRTRCWPGWRCSCRLFIMWPVLTEMNNLGVQPYLNGTVDFNGAARRRRPSRCSTSCWRTPGEEDIALMTRAAGPGQPGQRRRPCRCTTLIPAFMISELRAAFIIGFVDLRAVPGHRPRGLLGADVHGHDDAPAGDDLAAVQDPALRPRGRLGPDHHRADPELRGRLDGHQRRPGHRPAGHDRRRQARRPGAGHRAGGRASPSPCCSPSPRSRRSRSPSCPRPSPWPWPCWSAGTG